MHSLCSLSVQTCLHPFLLSCFAKKQAPSLSLPQHIAQHSPFHTTAPDQSFSPNLLVQNPSGFKPHCTHLWEQQVVYGHSYRQEFTQIPVRLNYLRRELSSRPIAGNVWLYLPTLAWHWGHGDNCNQGSNTYLVLLNISKKLFSHMGCNLWYALAVQRRETMSCTFFFLAQLCKRSQATETFFFLACTVSCQQLFNKTYQRYVISFAVEIEKKRFPL